MVETSSEAGWVIRAQAGDREAFAALVRAHERMAYVQAYHHLGNREDALDAAQDAFVQAFVRLGDLREPAHFAGWLRQILLNICRARLRGRRPVETLEAAAELEVAGPDPVAAERRQAIQAALGCLSEEARLTLELFYLGGGSYREVAATLEISVSTVRSRLRNARARLRKELIGMIEEEAGATVVPERFGEEVMARIMRAAAQGDAAEVGEVLRQQPAAANAVAAHPYWGGRPQPLQVAAEWGRLEVVRQLLDAGADPNAPDSVYDGWTPLHLALNRGHGPAPYEEVAQLLTERGARVDLCAAAALGNTERMRAMLEADPAVVHAPGPNRAPALHFAASAEVVRLLLEHGADPTATDSYGATAAQRLASRGDRNREAAVLLLDHTGAWDLRTAISLGELERVRALLEGDPALPTGSLGDDGTTPLHLAAAGGRLEIARLLLDRGADPNAATKDGETSLHRAAFHGHSNLAILLLQRGAGLDARDGKHGATPRDWAEFNGQKETAALLDEIRRQLVARLQGGS